MVVVPALLYGGTCRQVPGEPHASPDCLLRGGDEEDPGDQRGGRAAEPRPRGSQSVRPRTGRTAAPLVKQVSKVFYDIGLFFGLNALETHLH